MSKFWIAILIIFSLGLSSFITFDFVYESDCSKWEARDYMKIVASITGAIILIMIGVKFLL